jgi:hypothetical protein
VSRRMRNQGSSRTERDAPRVAIAPINWPTCSISPASARATVTALIQRIR